jgi:hypothetical protein
VEREERLSGEITFPDDEKRDKQKSKDNHADDQRRSIALFLVELKRPRKKEDGEAGTHKENTNYCGLLAMRRDKVTEERLTVKLHAPVPNALHYGPVALFPLHKTDLLCSPGHEPEDSPECGADERSDDGKGPVEPAPAVGLAGLNIEVSLSKGGTRLR